MKAFPFFRQSSAMDCGPTCLRMLAMYYGKHFNIEEIRKLTGFSKEGVNLLGISEAAEKIGFRSIGVQLTYEQLINEIKSPIILHWEQNHFVIAIPNFKHSFLFRHFHSLKKKEGNILIVDPARGKLYYNKIDFLNKWVSTTDENENQLGNGLLLEPNSKFQNQIGNKQISFKWKLLYQYLHFKKWQIGQVFLLLAITSILQLAFPFLTQNIVDKGIKNKNLNYITIILIAQLMLVFSRASIDFIRSRILLSVSSFINISLVSDFWRKLIRLPISYFDSVQAGDTIQRIDDNKQIQNFLTGSSINVLFSLFNFIILAFVLLKYNSLLFIFFGTTSILYIIWVKLFLSIRRKINYQTFHLYAKENVATLQMVQGMQEIKLNGAEQIKLLEWENIQKSIFKLNFKSLSYSQIQQAGGLIINQVKDIIITFIAAKLVISGHLTLGSMLAIQYVIGQLSSPVEQFIGFIQTMQDAKISLERLNEIHHLTDEEDPEINYLNQLAENRSIYIKNLYFTYPGGGNQSVLKNITLKIEEGKTTAIVGLSGSGKTTLLKLLLQFYVIYEGNIQVGEYNLNMISTSFWRKQCGTVLQDSYIFNDTIEKNIAVSDENIDLSKLLDAVKKANILPFIKTLPNGFKTKIGAEGMNISQGQKQRILIARAFYKNPQYLFFDEATNALDSNNEKIIVENMSTFFKGKTVVIVAHRLSTVKNADKIIVLKEGEIVEEGTHNELSQKKGEYFELVKNQLALGT